MERSGPGREELLEGGLAVLAGLLVAVGVMIGVSRFIGGMQRQRRREEKGPAAGAVPSSRHKGVGVAPASS